MWIMTASSASMEIINVDHVIRIRGKKEGGICTIVADTIDGKEAVITRIDNKLASSASLCPNCSECNKLTGFTRLFEVLKPYDFS